MPAKRLTAKTVLLTMVLTFYVCLLTGEPRDGYNSRRQQWSSSSNRHNRMSSHKETCCNGTLGYARSDPHVTCSDMRCCNKSETVAVIPINDVLGFRFRCVPRVSVRPECYPAGTNVRSSNEDHDYTPRICCDGAKFAVLINKWYSAMTIRCVTR